MADFQYQNSLMKNKSSLLEIGTCNQLPQKPLGVTLLPLSLNVQPQSQTR